MNPPNCFIIGFKNCHLGMIFRHTRMNIMNLSCVSEAKVLPEEACPSTPAWLHSSSWHVSTNTSSPQEADAKVRDQNCTTNEEPLNTALGSSNLQLCQNLFLGRTIFHPHLQRIHDLVCPFHDISVWKNGRRSDSKKVKQKHIY